MLYNFICPKCGEKTSVNVSASEIKDLIVKCPKCVSDMRRDWKTIIKIGDGDTADSIHETSFVKESLKKLPSGKPKVFY